MIGSAPSGGEIEIADRFLAWAKAWFGRGTVRNVFVWRVGNETRYALSGPADAMIRRMGFSADTRLDNRGGRFDRHLYAAFGISHRFDGSGSHPDLTHLWNEFEVGEMLGGLREFARSLVRPDRDMDCDVTILPEPGYPWAGPGTVYYDAAKHAILHPGAPPWIVSVTYRPPGESGEVTRPGADWCALAPRAEEAGAYSPGYMTIDDGGSPTSNVFATHTMNLFSSGRSTDEMTIASEVLRCRGLLFPSLAVAPIPASNYGPCTLVADPMLVLREIKPYKRPRSGRQRFFLYNTDAWTDVTRDFVGQYAVRLYDQLTGNADSDSYVFAGGRHLYILGPMPEEEGGRGWRPDDLKQITSTAQMVRAIRQRFKVWKGPLDERNFAKVIQKVASGHSRTANNYAFLEAKAHVIVPMGSFVRAWAPDFALDAYGSFLRAAGYSGPVHSMRTTAAEQKVFLGGAHDASADYVRYNYAWKMAAEMAAVLPHNRLMV